MLQCFKPLQINTTTSQILCLFKPDLILTFYLSMINLIYELDTTKLGSFWSQNVWLFFSLAGTTTGKTIHFCDTFYWKNITIKHVSWFFPRYCVTLKKKFFLHRLWEPISMHACTHCSLSRSHKYIHKHTKVMTIIKKYLRHVSTYAVGDNSQESWKSSS